VINYTGDIKECENEAMRLISIIKNS
jgi:hypothetical protein